ncbi:unnamed protein product, partial [Owenia fusiformis]
FGNTCTENTCEAGLVCHANVCSKCGSDSDCTLGEFCGGDPSSGRQCSAKKITGSKCNADTECDSGHCIVDACMECADDLHCTGQVCRENMCITLASFGNTCTENTCEADL